MIWRKQIAGVQLGHDVLTDDQKEFWYAPSSGPLHAAWKDKPTRLLYDLIRIWLVKDNEIERLKEELKETRLTAEDEARVRDEHFAEIERLKVALRETRECLRWVICAHHVECSESKAVLARHATLAGEGTNG